MRLDSILSSGEACERVEKDDDIVAVFDQASRLFDDHFGNLAVTLGGLIESRKDDLSLDAALHVGHLFGAFVDQKGDEEDLGIIGGDRMRNILQDDGLAGRSEEHTSELQ